MPRNAISFLVEQMPRPAPAGAILIVRSAEGVILGMNHACPCGCGGMGWMSFPAYGFKDHWEPQPKEGDDLAKMTLTPSIGFLRQPNGGFHWHGYLRDGVFEEC